VSVWTSFEFDDHEQVCFFSDEKTGLRAIVAIHSTFLGPAVGGTRFKSYDADAAALDDALRLSRAMSYKSALAGMPVGGGKSVIIGDPARIKTRALLHAFGRFINRIGNTFATGEDVGITVADIDTVAEVTRFVGGTSGGVGDPSVHTAVGVLHGFRAVLESQFDTDSCEGIRVAVQGLGAVGWRVAERLHAAGAKLLVADIRPDVVDKAVRTFGATAVPTRTIHQADVDIYAPCALGGVLTESSVLAIRAKAVAGAANNQLATPRAGVLLAERGILLAPDFVINAGGVISGLEAAARMPGRKPVEFAPLEVRLAAIHTRLAEIFRRSRAEGRPPEVTAEQMARELIGRR
jgi:leucine dehydrogenase